MQLATLLEDPEGATVLRLAREAHAAVRDHNYGGSYAAGSGAGAGRQAARSAWIAPAPALVRMRLFCLPYAGGVSENIFARRARPGHLLHVRCRSMCRRGPELLLMLVSWHPDNTPRPAQG